MATIFCKIRRRRIKNKKIGPRKNLDETHTFYIYYRDLKDNEIDHLPLGIFDKNVDLLGL